MIGPTRSSSRYSSPKWAWVASRNVPGNKKIILITNPLNTDAPENMQMIDYKPQTYPHAPATKEMPLYAGNPHTAKPDPMAADKFLQIPHSSYLRYAVQEDFHT